jgi:uncharacterized protein YbcC (UPF0753/DUF2309 family)
MNKTVLFAFLIVLVIGVIYVMKTSDKPPQSSMTQTPKEYIEAVERLKEAKRAAKQMEDSLERQQQEADQALEPASSQR